MTTQQPVWKLLINLGDATPLEYGGYFVLTDQTGVYPPEAELWEITGDGDHTQYAVYRMVLDRCTFLNGVLSDNPFHPEHPTWYADSLRQVASTIDMGVSQLIDDLCSENPINRAHAYRSLGEYHGWGNFDSYPLVLTAAEASERMDRMEKGGQHGSD